VALRTAFGMASLFRIGWRGTFPHHRQSLKGTLMAIIKTRVVAAVVRATLYYPRFTWWLARQVGPRLIRYFWRARLAAEDQALTALAYELRQATAGNDCDWYDVQALGELCIRQRAYSEAAQHFRRVVAAADDRELRRSAAAWLARALEYAGDRQGACLAYREYLHNFPEVSQFERRRLERRMAELCAPPNCADSDDVHTLPPCLPAGERPSRISVGRHSS